MSSEKQEEFRREYQAGKRALEKGEYRRSIEHLTAASKIVPSASSVGGEVQIWLVMAYQAEGMIEQAFAQRAEGIALCQKLCNHPYSEVRQQAKDLLYILQAPELKRPKEWMTEIPDLSKISDEDSKYFSSPGKGSYKPQKKPLPSPLDLSQINTKDNSFISVGLIALILILGGLIFYR
jgi:hypothetical protein